jgi:VIT1/CCC1 family predicted Fe2+/Mn2+ transporter
VPDPASVRISTWMRLQAHIAPVHRLLAAREAAEDDEVGDLYKRPTGDEATDALLREIRKEERSHSMAVSEMQNGAIQDPSAPQTPNLTPTQQRAKARLDKILGRESGHRNSGGWISGAIYGANDGLASVFGIVAGVSGATAGSSFVLTAGAAGAIASALSMATGAFLAERSEVELAEANLERERSEIAQHPEEEELSLFYQLKGVDEATADAMAEQLSHQPEAMLQALAAEEFGGAAGGSEDAKQAAIAAGISTGLGAMIPVIPFIFMHGAIAIVISAAISLFAHFLIGAAKSLVTLRTWWAAGLEMTLAGVIVGGVTFAVGLALPT